MHQSDAKVVRSQRCRCRTRHSHPFAVFQVAINATKTGIGIRDKEQRQRLDFAFRRYCTKPRHHCDSVCGVVYHVTRMKKEHISSRRTPTLRHGTPKRLHSAQRLSAQCLGTHFPQSENYTSAFLESASASVAGCRGSLKRVLLNEVPVIGIGLFVHLWRRERSCWSRCPACATHLLVHEGATAYSLLRFGLRKRNVLTDRLVKVRAGSAGECALQTSVQENKAISVR